MGRGSVLKMFNGSLGFLSLVYDLSCLLILPSELEFDNWLRNVAVPL